MRRRSRYYVNVGFWNPVRVRGMDAPTTLQMPIDKRTLGFWQARWQPGVGGFRLTANGDDDVFSR